MIQNSNPDCLAIITILDACHPQLNLPLGRYVRHAIMMQMPFSFLWALWAFWAVSAVAVVRRAHEAQLRDCRSDRRSRRQRCWPNRETEQRARSVRRALLMKMRFSPAQGTMPPHVEELQPDPQECQSWHSTPSRLRNQYARWRLVPRLEQASHDTRSEFVANQPLSWCPRHLRPEIIRHDHAQEHRANTQGPSFRADKSRCRDRR
jgi:hypothetical protein